MILDLFPQFRAPKGGGLFCPVCNEQLLGAWAAAKHAKDTGHGQPTKEQPAS